MRYKDLPEELKNLIYGEVTEHEDGSISVDGDVNWIHKKLTQIPIKFRRVSGDFLVYQNKITSLENAPDFVGGDFWCHTNQLTSLEGLGEVLVDVYCWGNLAHEKDLIAGYQRKIAKKELTCDI